MSTAKSQAGSGDWQQLLRRSSVTPNLANPRLMLIFFNATFSAILSINHIQP